MGTERALVLLALLLLVTPVLAHECWLEPRVFAPGTGDAVPVSMFVGEDFEGALRPFVRDKLVRLVHVTRAGERDLIPTVAWVGSVEAAVVTSLAPGTHVVGYVSTPRFIELAADKFEAYLSEEGLEDAIRARAAAGETGKAARELYTRYAKTVLACGTSDATATRALGWALEVTPREDLHAKKPGDRLAFTVTSAGKPVPGALVQAWVRGAKPHRARTDQDGAVAFTAAPGEWLVSVVTMTRATGDEADWESAWASITFELRAGPR